MDLIATTGSTAHRHREWDRAADRRRAPFLPLAILAASCAVLAPSLPADTVFLKDGTQIPNCKVTDETATHVSVQTSVGDMVVPKSEVFRILRTRTVYDMYKEQRSALKEGDINGLFKLASWCRSTNGLRKESDELLDQVISLKPNHSEARRMLGHVKLDGEWFTPKPLSIQLKADGPYAKDLRSDLDLFLQTRRDVRLAPASTPPETGTDPLDACRFDSTVIITRKAAGTFYGMSIGEPTFGATIRLQARSPWIGKTLLKTAAEGQVPISRGSESLAVHNAFGSSGLFIHKFLDQLTELRLKRIEEDFQKKKREKKSPGAPAPEALGQAGA